MELLPIGVPAITTLGFIVSAIALAELGKYPRAYSYGTIALIVFFAQAFSGLFIEGDPVTDRLILRIADVASGEVWWTPLTYIFLHADFFHLFGNIFILLAVGPLLESRIGARRFSVIFFGAGLAVPVAAAGLAAVTQNPMFSAPALGASGSVFGVLAAFATMYPNERVPVILLFFVVWLPAQIVFTMYIIFNLFYALGSTSIGWWGHFAGAAVGLASVPFLARSRRKSGVARVELDPADLEPLATTPTLKSILGHLRTVSRNEIRDDPQFRLAWLERFVERARCPRCGKKLDVTPGGLESDCGYKLPLRASRADG